MHYFKNFKGFFYAPLELFNEVTILIGRNGSGKTNVIEGIEFLANLAQGRPLYEISDLGRIIHNVTSMSYLTIKPSFVRVFCPKTTTLKLEVLWSNNSSKSR